MARGSRGGRSPIPESGAGILPQLATAPIEASSDGNLTYVTVPRPARSADAAADPPAPTRSPVARKRPDVDPAAETGEISIEALVTADRSQSSTFSKERVESWRATVEASQDFLDSGSDGERASPTPGLTGKRSDGPVATADKADAASSEGTPRAGRIRSQSSPDGYKPLRVPRQLKNSRDAASQSSRNERRDAVQDDLDGADAPAGPRSDGGEQAKRMRFGRDRTNEAVDRGSGDGSELATISSTYSTPQKRKRRPQKRARTAKKPKPSQRKEESDDDEEERKQRARAKWAAIDSYAMETVYTL
ncbi:hypothetical protein BMF94_5511 [Rhodotorula taiwanensis]|uniref:Uncharacterized protein n=1 Tax=Rhodotorula taiwanensis TaxID=741276 RepID=A0A2S5B353_9BASI|nr:hypothetical protein BMF94_5511 [Rhodotorula taiwanensis]